MAQKRRGGGGFRPPEIKGTLGTLLRTALHQASAVTDAARSAARDALGQGRERLSNVRASRRRTDLLADLGDLVLDLIRRGEIDLGELPEAQDLIAQLDELDSEEPEEHDIPRPAAPRERFDLRGARDAEDGTVSSGAAARWSPPRPGKPAGERVWRPPGADISAAPPPRPAHNAPAEPKAPPPAPRKGGISFDSDDDDSDLGDYMHPDDVPPKGAPGT